MYSDVLSPGERFARRRLGRTPTRRAVSRQSAVWCLQISIINDPGQVYPPCVQVFRPTVTPHFYYLSSFFHKHSSHSNFQRKNELMQSHDITWWSLSSSWKMRTTAWACLSQFEPHLMDKSHSHLNIEIVPKHWSNKQPQKVWVWLWFVRLQSAPSCLYCSIAPLHLNRHWWFISSYHIFMKNDTKIHYNSLSLVWHFFRKIKILTCFLVILKPF